MLTIFTTLLTGTNQGLLWAIMAVGVYISYRLLDFADLTVEGSFATGGATAAIIMTLCNGFVGDSAARGMFIAIVAILASVVMGGLAGLVTGLLHTKLKIAPILSGILTMTGLYSINLIILGLGSSPKSALGLGAVGTLFTYAQKTLPINLNWIIFIIAIIFVVLVIALLYWFCGTEVGSAMRATGNNEKMAKAQGINTQSSKILGLVISNAFVGLAGALVAFQESNAAVVMGVGSIVAGLAAIIIGESIISSKFPFWARLLSIAIGSVIYRVIIAYIYLMGVNPEYVKLLTAALVVFALCIPLIKEKVGRMNLKKGKNKKKNGSIEPPADSGEENAEDPLKVDEIKEETAVDGQTAVSQEVQDA